MSLRHPVVFFVNTAEAYQLSIRIFVFTQISTQISVFTQIFGVCIFVFIAQIYRVSIHAIVVVISFCIYSICTPQRWEQTY